MSDQLLVSESGPNLTAPPKTTWDVQAQKPVAYRVVVSRDILDPHNPALLDAGTVNHSSTVNRGSRRRFLVIDANVDRLYGDRLRAYLKHHDVDYHICTLDSNEESKNMDSVFHIVDDLDKFGIDRRREPIIGIGGGVLQDIVGLTASLYRRHTPYVRVPTTLIGLVDAGVGVKTGVNFGGHKNRLGSYEPPAVALLDRTFLKTVDRRHISNGLAEILKIGLIKDGELFALLDEFGDVLLSEHLQGETAESEAATRHVLWRAVHGMLEELQPNLWEHQLERVVDYGHSFSPTIEMGALPALLHGEAVTVDMAFTTVLAWRRNLISIKNRDRVLSTMRRLDLPVWHELCDPNLLSRALDDTVRHRDGLQRLPLPMEIGDACFVNDVTAQELAAAAKDLRALASDPEVIV